MEQELLGSPWDAISCAGAYAVAATTGTFRIAGDVHYLTDVAAGAALGTLVGYGIPLLHLRNPELGRVKAGGASFQVIPSGLGAGLAGVF